MLMQSDERGVCLGIFQQEAMAAQSASRDKVPRGLPGAAPLQLRKEECLGVDQTRKGGKTTGPETQWLEPRLHMGRLRR